MDDNAPSIFRIFIPVTDLEKAVHFYRRLLGVDGRAITRASRHYFECGQVIMAIVENSGTPIADHVYFSVHNLDDIYARAIDLGCLEAATVRDAAAGAIVVRPWGERSFYARDPFGNGLCFVDEQTLFTG